VGSNVNVIAYNKLNHKSKKIAETSERGSPERERGGGEEGKVRVRGDVGGGVSLWGIRYLLLRQVGEFFIYFSTYWKLLNYLLS
jgi:hypothetical protein